MIMVMVMTIMVMMMMMATNLIKTPLSSAVPDRSTLLQLNHAVCSRGEQTIQDIFDLIIFSFPKNDNYRNLRYRVILMLNLRYGPILRPPASRSPAYGSASLTNVN